MRAFHCRTARLALLAADAAMLPAMVEEAGSSGASVARGADQKLFGKGWSAIAAAGPAAAATRRREVARVSPRRMAARMSPLGSADSPLFLDLRGPGLDVRPGSASGPVVPSSAVRGWKSGGHSWYRTHCAALGERAGAGLTAGSSREDPIRMDTSCL